jgi:hypothetical protein
VKITPEFVPHYEFHKGAWLQSIDNPGWYYFMKSKNPNIISNPSFLESVDEPLKELVTFLHQKGIRTTPSCSGHFKSERNLEKIYSDLEADKKQITGNGLKLKDIETGNIYLFKNKKYLIPWGRDTFITELLSYQQHGVIGMRLANEHPFKEKILKIVVEGTNIKEKDNIIFIYTNENNKGDNRETWKKITTAIINLFMENA